MEYTQECTYELRTGCDLVWLQHKLPRVVGAALAAPLVLTMPKSDMSVRPTHRRRSPAIGRRDGTPQKLDHERQQSRHILLAVTPREWQQKQYVQEYTLILRAGWLHWLSTSRYHAWSSTSGADGPHDAQVRAVAEADQR